MADDISYLNALVKVILKFKAASNHWFVHLLSIYIHHTKAFADTNIHNDFMTNCTRLIHMLLKTDKFNPFFVYNVINVSSLL